MMKCVKAGVSVVGTKNDKRVKIPKSEYTNIKKMHENGYSLRELARLYSVSHRLIFCIVHDDFNKKENGQWKKYYDKEKHKMSIRKYREHLNEIYNGGIQC